MEHIEARGIFSKQSLLRKLGATGLSEKKPIRHQFSNPDNRGFGGFAEVRFMQGDKKIVAEACFWGKRDNGDSTDIRPFNRPEIVEIIARKSWVHQGYEITSINVDGEDFDPEQEGIVNLAIAIFLSRIDEMESLVQEREADLFIDEEMAHAPSATIASEADMVRACLDTVFNEEKRVRAARLQARMPRVEYGAFELRFDGLIDMEEAAY